MSDLVRLFTKMYKIYSKMLVQVHFKRLNPKSNLTLLATDLVGSSSCQKTTCNLTRSMNVLVSVSLTALEHFQNHLGWSSFKIGWRQTWIFIPSWGDFSFCRWFCSCLFNIFLLQSNRGLPLLKVTGKLLVDWVDFRSISAQARVVASTVCLLPLYA